MITILAESEHENKNIANKQIEIINSMITRNNKLVIMEMSPLSLWIMQDIILSGCKNIKELEIYINPTWSYLRKTLTKLAIQGKIYLLSYDMIQIFSGDVCIHVKNYFNITLPDPWIKNNIDTKKIQTELNKISIKKYNNIYNDLYCLIFKNIIKYIPNSCKAILKYREGNDPIWLNYMITRDTIGAKYINNLLKNFTFDIIVICHIFHAYYKKYHKKRNDLKYNSGYSNKLVPFASNIKGKKRNIMIIDKTKKYPINTLEYHIKNKIKLDNKKDYLELNNILLYPGQFDEYLLA